MKKVVFLFLISIIANFKIYAQVNSQVYPNIENEIFTICFDDLPENKYLDSIGSKLDKKIKFCYLFTCFSQLTENNPKPNKEIYLRIKEIAKKLHSENKPVLIIGGCKSFSKILNLKHKSLVLN